MAKCHMQPSQAAPPQCRVKTVSKGCVHRHNGAVAGWPTDVCARSPRPTVKEEAVFRSYLELRPLYALPYATLPKPYVSVRLLVSE